MKKKELQREWVKGIMEEGKYSITSLDLARYLGKRHIDVKRKLDKQYRFYICYHTGMSRHANQPTKIYHLEVRHLRLFKEVEQEVIDKMVENYRIAWNAPSPLLDLLFKR